MAHGRGAVGCVGVHEGTAGRGWAQQGRQRGIRCTSAGTLGARGTNPPPPHPSPPQRVHLARALLASSERGEGRGARCGSVTPTSSTLEAASPTKRAVLR